MTATLAIMQDAFLSKHAFARRLRRHQTDVERKLWYALRDRRLARFKFRRQQPIGPYIADFFCSDAKLIVELDGDQHGEIENRRKDEMRTGFLEAHGYKMLRFGNRDLIEDMESVIEAIFVAADDRRRRTPQPQSLE
ncbi:MAG TPA: endonuclease domain-containing protein [Rhizomicrobium sp.]|nr:endonuclease domain-containing protein [Rhizomicrobium sp.]